MVGPVPPPFGGIAAVISDIVNSDLTGEYSFDKINPEPRYVVVAYDYKHNFRAVIADNLRAEPMSP